MGNKMKEELAGGRVLGRRREGAKWERRDAGDVEEEKRVGGKNRGRGKERGR